jgi:hypothetical protein
MGVSLEVGHFSPWYMPNLESIAQIFGNVMSIVYYVCQLYKKKLSIFCSIHLQTAANNPCNR